MKKRITFYLFFIASLLYAQGTLQLSVNDCVELALKNNVTIKIADAKVTDAKYSKYQSWGSILPKVDVRGINIVDEKIRPIDNFFYVPGITPDPNNPLTYLMSEPYLEMDFTLDYQFDLSVTQPIFTGGKILNGIRLANTNSHIEVLSNEIEKREMTYKVVQTYFGVLLTRQYKNVASEAYKMANDFYDITEIMYEQGMVSKLDLLQADVQVSNLLPQKTKAENAVQLAESGLRIFKSSFVPFPRCWIIEATCAFLLSVMGRKKIFCNCLQMSLESNSMLSLLATFVTWIQYGPK